MAGILADAMNLKIHVIESSESFAEITINEGTSFMQHPRSIYLGHIGELHYVSTLPALSETSIMQTVNETSQVNAMLNCGCGRDAKEKRSTCMNPEKGKLKPVNTFHSYITSSKHIFFFRKTFISYLFH